MTKSNFEFTDEARASLCPFVGTEGMQCFDGEPINSLNKSLDARTVELPRGVGISMDRSTGRLKALAIQLTSAPETGRIWTDRFTGEIYDTFNEALLGSPNRFEGANNASRILIFRNASQLSAAWQQTFKDGRIRGGLLARPPNLLKYNNDFSSQGNALILSQTIVSLYTLSINHLKIQLNSFARNAISKLTSTLDLELYDDFVNKWGTHIITKSLIGGMIEEQAKAVRNFYGDERSLLVRCVPFEDRPLSASACFYYKDRNPIINKRRLGGNAYAQSNHEWKKSLAFAPAMIQILEMVPWYEFVEDEMIKTNLHTIIQHRQKIMDSIQTEMARSVDVDLTSRTSVSLNLSVDAQWEQNAVTVAGGKGQGGNYDQLDFPHGFQIDDDEDLTISIADFRNHRIIQWKKGDTSGQVVAGGKGSGNRLDQLSYPADLLIDKETNSFIIVDRTNSRIVRWSRRRGTAQGEILIDNFACWGLAMDEQRNLYVSDQNKHEVRRYEIYRGDRAGTVVAGGNGYGSGLNQLSGPGYISLGRNQTLYVSDWYNNRVIKWDKGATEGIVVAGGQGEGSSLTQLWHPTGTLVDEFGTLYVADEYNHRVMRWPQGSKQGTVILGGNGGAGGANQLYYPYGLAFDKRGNFYVADRVNNRVQRFNLIK